VRDASTLDVHRSVVVLVDYQERLLPAIADGETVVAQALALARIARELGVPVIGTEQNPRGLGSNLPALRELCGQTLSKTLFDACADGLRTAIESTGRGGVGSAQIVIAGCEAHVCLLQSALGLCRAGFPVAVIAAACGSRRPCDRELALARLRDAGAAIASVEMVAFEWLRGSDHPRFKSVLRIVKEASRAASPAKAGAAGKVDAGPLSR